MGTSLMTEQPKLEYVSLLSYSRGFEQRKGEGLDDRPWNYLCDKYDFSRNKLL